MYEMHIGASATGSGLVWHVVVHDESATLCGQSLQADGAADTDLHCASCMAVFQDLMRRAPEA